MKKKVEGFILVKGGFGNFPWWRRMGKKRTKKGGGSKLKNGASQEREGMWVVAKNKKNRRCSISGIGGGGANGEKRKGG